MHAPFAALEAIANPIASDQLDTREPELRGARRLKIVPNPLAVVAEEFVAGDLVRHGAAMHKPWRICADAEGPNAMEFVPKAFVAIEHHGGVSGRALGVIQPVGARIEEGDCAGAQISAVELHGAAGARSGTGSGFSTRASAANGLVNSANDEGLIRIHTTEGGVEWKADNIARDFGVQVRCADDSAGRAPGAVIDVTGFAADFNTAAATATVSAARDDKIDGVIGEVDSGKPRGSGDEQLVAFGRVGVLMKVKAGAARLAGEAKDAMTCGGLEPLLGRLGAQTQREEALATDEEDSPQQPETLNR